MKKLFLIPFLLICGYSSVGQTISELDSLGVMDAVKSVFQNFEKPNYSSFQKIAADDIWCLICNSGKPPVAASQYIDSRTFYEKLLKTIAVSADWQRAITSKEINLHRENQAEITAFITTWKAEEYAPRHEGSQLGIRFRKVNGVYLFSGIETVP
ncbi:hypothetical protein H7F15_03625 [Pontibacter sp. Tf4]|uniref:hypothetical protein n=1 Tax=Pontibacter sp. Tf4 TaxID=2761620 RepID=UPI0016282C47|nr:hypothetical protein [Pontibacter sp. Tf4]MBB6610118.1 hypothetical protein [Pontibacter sp. Tf4]